MSFLSSPARPARTSSRSPSPSPSSHPFARAYSPLPPAHGPPGAPSVPPQLVSGLPSPRSPLPAPKSFAAPSSLPPPPRMWMRQPNDSASRISSVSPSEPRPTSSARPVTLSPVRPALPPTPPESERGEARSLGHSRSFYLRQRKKRSSIGQSTIGQEDQEDLPTHPWIDSAIGTRSCSSSGSRSSPRSRSSSRSNGSWVDLSKVDLSKDGKGGAPSSVPSTPDVFTDSDDEEEDLTDPHTTLSLPPPPAFRTLLVQSDNGHDAAGTKRGFPTGLLKKNKFPSLPALRALVASSPKPLPVPNGKKMITAVDLGPPVAPSPPRFSDASRKTADAPHPPSSTTSFFASLGRTASQSHLAQKAMYTLHRRKSSASSDSSSVSRSSSVRSREPSIDEFPLDSPTSTTSSSTVRPVNHNHTPIATTGQRHAIPSFTASPPSPSSSCASSLPPTTPRPPSRSLPGPPTVQRSPSTPESILSTRSTISLASEKKLRQVLGVEAAGGHCPPIPPSRSSSRASVRPPDPDDLEDDFDRKLTLSLLEFQTEPIQQRRIDRELPPLPVAIPTSTLRMNDSPPRLDFRRETVDFSKTLLRLSAADFSWEDNGDLRMPSRSQEAAEPDSPLLPPSMRNEAVSVARTHHPLPPKVLIPPSAFTSDSSITNSDDATPIARRPALSVLFSPISVHGLQIASSFPLPPPLPTIPSKEKSTLVSRRKSSLRQVGRSQSYKRSTPRPLAANSSTSREISPSSPLKRQVSLKHRTSVKRQVSVKRQTSVKGRTIRAGTIIRKQRSAGHLKDTARWGTRSATVLVSKDEPQATVPSLPPRPSLQLRGSAGSIECASGHDAHLNESAQVDTRRTTILQQDAWVTSPATALETSFSLNRSSTNS